MNLGEGIEANYNISLPPTLSPSWALLKGTAFMDSDQQGGNQSILDRSNHAQENVNSFFLFYLPLIAGLIVSMTLGNPFFTGVFLGLISLAQLDHLVAFNTTTHDKYITGHHIARDNVPGDYVLTQKSIKAEAGVGEYLHGLRPEDYLLTIKYRS